VSLNHEIVGVDSEPAERSWTEADVLLYALAVGAGQQDPLAELDFTTENSIGFLLKVLPTFDNMIAWGSRGPNPATSTQPHTSTPGRRSRCTSRCRRPTQHVRCRGSSACTTRAARCLPSPRQRRSTRRRPASRWSSRAGPSSSAARAASAAAADRPQAGRCRLGRRTSRSFTTAGRSSTAEPADRGPQPAALRSEIRRPRRL
jgi:hypothetical protein